MDKYVGFWTSIEFKVLQKDGPRVVVGILGSFPCLSLHIQLVIA